MYIWDYWGASDPGDTLTWFTTGQIEWWNDPCWSNEEFDTLAEEQFGEMDKAARLDMIHRMQEIMYSETPEVILDYPPSLQVVNTDEVGGLDAVHGRRRLVRHLQHRDLSEPPAQERRGGERARARPR